MRPCEDGATQWQQILIVAVRAPQILIQQYITTMLSICEVIYYQNAATGRPHVYFPSVIQRIVVDYKPVRAPGGK